MGNETERHGTARWVVWLSIFTAAGCMASRGPQPRPFPPVDVAAALDLLWEERIGPINVKGFMATGAAALPDGSFVVAGQSTGSLVFGRDGEQPTRLVGGQNLYGRRPFLARYDTDGRLLWARSVGGNFIHHVTALPDGSLAVTGEIMPFENYGNDFGVSRRFGAGTPEETHVPGCEPLIARQNALYPSGGPGFTTGFPSGRGEGQPTCDIFFVARYDSDGRFQWVRTVHGVRGAKSTGIAALPDGSLVLTAQLGGVVLFDAATAQEDLLELPVPRNMTSYRSTAFLIRYGPDGSVAWAREVAGAGEHVATSGVAAMADGSIVVAAWAGSYWSSTARDHVLAPRVSVARFDGRGNRIWERGIEIEGPSAKDALILAEIPGGDLAIAFGAELSGSMRLRWAGGQRLVRVEASEDRAKAYLIARFDADGAMRWLWQASRAEDRRGLYLKTLSALPDGSLVVAGAVRGPAVLAPGHRRELVWEATEHYRVYVARFAPDGSFDSGFDTGAAFEGRRIDGAAVLPDGSMVTIGSRHEGESQFVVSRHRFVLEPGRGEAAGLASDSP
jgi:hypothetical protein